MPSAAFETMLACWLWFSLPLAIWLMSGWIGLVLHWHVELTTLWRPGKAVWRQEGCGQLS